MEPGQCVYFKLTDYNHQHRSVLRYRYQAFTDSDLQYESNKKPVQYEAQAWFVACTAADAWCTAAYVRTCSQESAGTLSLWLDMCVNMWQRGKCQYRQKHLSCQQRLPITESEIERNKTAGIITALSKQKCSREDCQQPSVRYRKTQIIRTLVLEERVTTSATPGPCVGEETDRWAAYSCVQCGRAAGGYGIHFQKSFWRLWGI